MSMLPTPGNLAWAPVAAVENVEILDRFNGVPTFGLFTAGGERQLFWRLTGYVTDAVSVWLYVPLTAADENRLACADPPDLLDGLVFRSPVPRYVTVGVAHDYRLIFEREWQLPEDADPQSLLREVLMFLVEAMLLSLREDLPPARRELVYATSEALRASLPPGRLLA